MAKPKSKLPKNAKPVFKGVIFEVWQWRQTMFNRGWETFEMLKRPNTAQAIPVVGDKILILKQKQPNRLKAFYSIAGGRCESGEPPLKAAKRELLEETGYVSGDWRLLKKINPVGKIVWTVYTYIARRCVYKQPPRLDSGEKITSQLMTFDQFLKLADQPNFYEPELVNYLLRARADKKIYNQFHKLLFK